MYCYIDTEGNEISSKVLQKDILYTCETSTTHQKIAIVETNPKYRLSRRQKIPLKLKNKCIKRALKKLANPISLKKIMLGGIAASIATKILIFAGTHLGYMIQGRHRRATHRKLNNIVNFTSTTNVTSTMLHNIIPLLENINSTTLEEYIKCFKGSKNYEGLASLLNILNTYKKDKIIHSILNVFKEMGNIEERSFVNHIAYLCSPEFKTKYCFYTPLEHATVLDDKINKMTEVKKYSLDDQILQQTFKKKTHDIYHNNGIIITYSKKTLKILMTKHTENREHHKNRENDQKVKKDIQKLFQNVKDPVSKVLSQKMLCVKKITYGNFTLDLTAYQLYTNMTQHQYEDLTVCNFLLVEQRELLNKFLEIYVKERNFSQFSHLVQNMTSAEKNDGSLIYYMLSYVNNVCRDDKTDKEFFDKLGGLLLPSFKEEYKFYSTEDNYRKLIAIELQHGESVDTFDFSNIVCENDELTAYFSENTIYIKYNKKWENKKNLENCYDTNLFKDIARYLSKKRKSVDVILTNIEVDNNCEMLKKLLDIYDPGLNYTGDKLRHLGHFILKLNTQSYHNVIDYYLKYFINKRPIKYNGPSVFADLLMTQLGFSNKNDAIVSLLLPKIRENRLKGVYYKQAEFFNPVFNNLSVEFKKQHNFWKRNKIMEDIVKDIKHTQLRTEEQKLDKSRYLIKCDHIQAFIASNTLYIYTNYQLNDPNWSTHRKCLDDYKHYNKNDHFRSFIQLFILELTSIISIKMQCFTKTLTNIFPKTIEKAITTYSE